MWVYADHTVPQWLETTVAEEKETRKLGFDIYPYYDVTAPTPPPGSYILDFNSENTERVILDGLYQVLRDSPLIKRRGSNVLLCREARFDDLPLGNRKRWEQAATKAANGDFKSWKASDFASDFLVSSA